jgi:hypothetical protein
MLVTVMRPPRAWGKGVGGDSVTKLLTYVMHGLDVWPKWVRAAFKEWVLVAGLVSMECHVCGLQQWQTVVGPGVACAQLLTGAWQ